MSFRSAAILVSLCLASPSFAAPGQSDPLRFFEGKTESVGTIKIVMKKPFRSRAIGVGQISSDGTLTLVQRIEDEGQLPKERRWKMRKVASGKYTGTMNEAKGPVTVDEVDGKYRFRFRMEGNVAVEQWLIPAPDGRSATSTLTIRKYGMTVGHSDAVIHKTN